MPLICAVFGNAKKLKDQRQSEEETLAETERARENAQRERDEKEREIRKLSGDIGAKESRVRSYDEVEDSFNREFGADLRRNLLGLYEDGALEIFRKEIECGTAGEEK